MEGGKELTSLTSKFDTDGPFVSSEAGSSVSLLFSYFDADGSFVSSELVF